MRENLQQWKFQLPEMYSTGREPQSSFLLGINLEISDSGAQGHQRQILADLRDLAAAAGAKLPARLAREILLLVMGAIVATQINGPVDAGKAAKKAAEVLIEEVLAAPEVGDAA